jgi:outer membrane protein OmpA-like peptidoglycan-associated protein
MKQTLFVLLLLSGFGIAAAQSPGAPSVDDMVKALTPAPKTRSLGAGTRNLVPTLDLTVNFDFDSAWLRPDGRDLLKSLASALSDPRLQNFRFRVEGHTDGQGTEAYNDQLSQRRADAVVAYLLSTGVQTERLEAVGKGFRELLDQADPKSPANRRVRVVTLP